uniref:Uncharacterized protein n=1 Tax=Arundo donax TaxID=35708 RepID=A0A0A9HQ61_ARUDO
MKCVMYRMDNVVATMLSFCIVAIAIIAFAL